MIVLHIIGLVLYGTVHTIIIFHKKKLRKEINLRLHELLHVSKGRLSSRKYQYDADEIKWNPGEITKYFVNLYIKTAITSSIL